MTPEEHIWLDNVYAGTFNGGPSCGRPVPETAGADIAGKNSMFAHLDYMTSLLEGLAKAAPVPPPAVDVDALATALAPHLEVGATADQIAHVVMMHFGAALTAAP